MTLRINLNLLQDNNGVAGDPLNQDQITVNDSFFVEIEVADIRDDSAGVIGLALDIAWDASILEALDTQITEKLPLNPQGAINNENGLIDDLGAGAIPNFNLGEAVGVNQLERFALLHFQGELVTADAIPLTVTVSDPRNVAFADGTPFDGETDIEVQTLEVTPENTPPTLVNEIGDLATAEDSEFSFTISNDTFQDPDEGDSLTYSAMLENGSDLPNWITFDAETKTFSGTPNNGDIGSLDLKITVTDNDGATASDIFTLTVENVDDLPVVSNPIDNVQVNENAEDKTLDLSNVFSDVDGDEITLAVKTNSNETLVVPTLDGTDLTLDFLDEQFGEAEITVEATANGEMVSDTFKVTVNEVTPDNTPPTLVNEIDDLATAEDSEFNFTISDNTFQDLDEEDSLTYSAMLEDGSDLPDWITFNAETKTFSGTPNNGDIGSLDLKVTVTDNDGETASNTFTLTVANVDDAPVVSNEIADIEVDEDADNSVIDLSNVFTDIDNDDNAIVKTVKTNSNKALVTTSIDGNNLTLDYLDNQSGTADITLIGTSNGLTVEETFTVTVNAVDDIPVVSNRIEDVTVNENANNSIIDLSNVFSDADGDEITLAVKANTNNSLVTPTLDGNNLILDVVDEQFGSGEITIEATANGQIAEDTFLVTVNEVTPENTPPTLENPLGDLAIQEESEFSLTIPENTFNDADPEDILTYSATLEDGGGLPAWLTFNPDTKTFNGTPVSSDIGTLDLKVTATDNSEEMASDIFTLTVENIDDIPSVQNEIADLTVDEDAEDSVIDLNDVFTDIDNDDDAIVKTISANSNEDLVTASINGNNLTLDYLDNQSGTAEITIQGSSNGQTVTDRFTVNVNPVDDLPFVSNEIGDLTVNENAEDRTIDLSNVFRDIDGDEITLAVTNNSNDSLVATTLDDSNLTLDFLDEQFGEADITIEATANGAMVSDTFTVNVDEVIPPPPTNTAPILANEIIDGTATEDSEFSLIIPENTFVDADEGDSLTYSVTLANGEALPTWLTFDADTATFTGTPEDTNLASLEIKVIATDKAGETISDIFALNVDPIDDPPTVNNQITDLILEEDAENTIIDLSDVFTDIDNDNNAIIKGIPANTNSDLVVASIDDNDLILDYQDDRSGTADITIKGTSNGLTVENTFSVTVNPVDDPPAVKNEIADVVVREDAKNTIIDLSGVFSDIDNDDSAIIKTISINSNEDLVTASIDNNNLTLDYQDEHSGTAEITVEGESNGKIVSDTFNITVEGAIATDIYLVGTDGADELEGTTGNDTIFGGIGDDSIIGGMGDDFLVGLTDDDLIKGEEGNDFLVGYDGDDSVLGGEGDDILFGSIGNDTLNGGTGNDLLSGGTGNDLLSGGMGNDTLWGKEGADVFVLELGQGQDVISDFIEGEDKLALGNGISFNNLTISGDIDAQIVDGDDHTLVVLSGVSASAISADNFIAL